MFYLGLAVLGYFLYKRSVKTRKSYICSECSETTYIEHMDVTHCSFCGAEFQEKDKQQ